MFQLCNCIELLLSLLAVADDVTIKVGLKVGLLQLGADTLFDFCTAQIIQFVSLISFNQLDRELVNSLLH